MAALAFAAPAAADVLVSNVTPGSSPSDSGIAVSDLAQGFTTGSNPTGYTLTNVELALAGPTTGPITVRIVTGLPSTITVVANLTSPATFKTPPPYLNINTFTAPAGTMLDADTTYYVLVQTVSGSGAFAHNASPEESGAPGWSIANNGYERRKGPPLQDWTSVNRTFQIRINGTTNAEQAASSGRKAALERTLAALGRQLLTSALDSIDARFAEPAPGAEGAAAAPDPRALRWGVWGRGDVASFEGGPGSGSGSRHKGSTRSVWLGMDARSGPWVAGLAASRSWSDAGYRFGGGDNPGGRGRLETTLNALYPYGRWRFGGSREVRAMLGAGDGTADHRSETGGSAEKSDLSMRLASVGLRQELPPIAQMELAVRADAGWVELDTESGARDIDGLTADSWQARLGAEASRDFAPAAGTVLAPFLEVVGRREGGDAPSGSGLEVAGGARYGAERLQVELRGRVLTAHSEAGMDERGVSVTAQLLPEAHGRGLSLSLNPRWGAAADGAEMLWRGQLPQVSGPADETAVDAQVGYGIALLPGRGLLTPFAEASLAGGERGRYRIGTRFETSRADLEWEVFGEHVGARPDYRLGVGLRARF